MSSPVAPHPLPVEIGRVIDPHAPRFPGKLFPYIGFGDDLPAEVEEVLLTALGRRVGWGPSLGQLVAQRRTQASWQSAWTTQVMTAVEHGPVPFDGTHVAMVTPHLIHLRGRRVHKDLRLKHLMVAHGGPKKPPRIVLPVKSETVWASRHYPFARGVWYDLIVHLRTMELTNADYVIERLLTLFRRYCSIFRGQTFEALDTDCQQAEYRDLYLSLYKQTLLLLGEMARNEPRYRQAIAERQLRPGANDQVLDYPRKLGEVFDLNLAREIRTGAYQAMLNRMLGYCAFALSR